MSLSLSLLVLTYNEEKNIEFCLKSVVDIAKDIFIIDSFSTDKTLEIAKKYTNNIYQRKFIEHSDQFNWALKNLPIQTQWVMRLDADEYVTDELASELLKFLPNVSSDIQGLYVKREVVFMNKWIKYGGYYPINLLRIWRKDMAFLEDIVSVDQHIVLRKGKKHLLKHNIVDKNRKNLVWWINKHNAYSTREAVYSILENYGLESSKKIPIYFFGTQEERKRFLKSNFYLRMPLFIRAFFYFFYRYLFRLGFLDGLEGLCWHFLQGLWYRFLVDAKIYEIKRKIRLGQLSLEQIKKEYTI